MGRLFALALVAATCVAVGMLVLVTACITAPPPQLPAEVEHRPTILNESVQPPAELTLQDLPPEFAVPVELEDPNESFEWDVFIDYTANDPSTGLPTPEQTPPGIVQVQPTPATEDGGAVIIYFSPPTDLDPSRCHTIQFVVAHQFLQGLPHTPAPPGGDLVTWTYDPGGAVQCSDLVYDAGRLQDGAFPPTDSGAEALPAVPESGTD